MVKLNTDHLIYLFYADAYSEEDTVTKGRVKSLLPKDCKSNADKIYEDLQKKKLVEQKKNKYRFEVTEQGKQVLLSNLIITDYKFDTSKGPKITNALLRHLKKLANDSPQAISSEMNFPDFQEKFKRIFFETRKIQSLKGVAVVRKQELVKSAIAKLSMSQGEIEEYFEILRSKGEISVTEGRDDELVEWVE
jgi:hypothetical protein